ncbi:MAG: BtrH N-terminal domain-containing protein [Clostridia bacterium]|nr:BtrH N-terminal domain-containing protein [Clostridia bacterium]
MQLTMDEENLQSLFSSGSAKLNGKELKKFKVIDSVIENDDNYSWAELNCFNKPMAIIFKSFDAEYFNLFLFYLSYINTFLLDMSFEEFINEDNAFFSPSFNSMIVTNFGIEIEKVYFDNEWDMHAKITEEIDKSSRLLFPINSIGLYYHSNYMEAHNRHFMIVNGYNNLKKIYYTMENSHIDDGTSTLYKKFVIKFSDLFNASKLYLEQFEPEEFKSYFWAFRKIGQPNIKIDYKKALFDLYTDFMEMNEGKTRIKYIENEIIKMIVKENRSNCFSKSSIQKISSTLNFKSVFYDLLFKFLNKLNTHKGEVSDLSRLALDITREWYDIRMHLFMCISRNSMISERLETKVQENVAREKMFREHFIKIASGIKQKSFFEDKDTKDKYIEKNFYNACIARNGNTIEMFLPEGKSYNTWLLQDNAPQMLIYPNAKEDFKFETKVTPVTDNKLDHSDQSGILLKLNDGTKYLFGKFGWQKLSLYCPQDENFILMEENFYYPHVYLLVRRTENSYTFMYRTEREEAWKEAYSFQTAKDIECYGVFARTWNELEHKVVFSEIQAS